MKKITLLSIIALGVSLLGGFSRAHADEVVGNTGSTPTEVTIKDAGDTGTDPLDPTDPTQTHLTLETVPNAYNFETAVKNKTYALSATLSNKDIVVFNDRTDRDWSVKAVVTNNKITRSSDSSTFNVDSFKVNGIEIAATGATGIVAKSEATKTAQNNTGNIPTAVTSISIGFTDMNNTLKTGDTLAGAVTYQLYNTATAN